MKSTSFPYLNLSMVIVSLSKLNSWIQYSNSSLFASVIPKPSSINLLNKIGQIIFLFVLLFSFRRFSSFAMYMFASIGATFVPIITPKICWKYSPSNDIRLFFKINSKSSIINLNSAFGMTFWYSQTSCLIVSIASSTGMLVYKLLKSIVNKKHFLLNLFSSKIFTKLKLSVKIESNLE